MRILVTGGSGVIGRGTIPELLARGHHVRLLSRRADEDAKEWRGVESFGGDVADPQSIRGALGGCDGVIHIAGIAAEELPEVTFERVNVEGTRNLIDEAMRAGVRRFVYVSSLGADTGGSDYHASKRKAEEAVRSSGLQWTIVRPGSVYGPGDEVISTILQMVRALPAIPIIDDGNQRFQPIWYEDAGAALAAIIDRPDLRGAVLEIAGSETTSMNDLLERFAVLTGRQPARVPVPMPLAALATSIASRFIDLPIDETKLTMLEEDNVTHRNALTSLLKIAPLSLDDGLERLADELPEQLADEGVGPMRNKRYTGLIRNSGKMADEVMTIFRDQLNDVMPFEFEAEGTTARVERGSTITAQLPLRGNIQIRVEIVEARRVLFATLKGHPIAGTVDFRAVDAADGVLFTIEIFARFANLFDLVTMQTLGSFIQDANWRAVIRRVAARAGGTVDGIEHTSRRLAADEAVAREELSRRQVQSRMRDGA